VKAVHEWLHGLVFASIAGGASFSREKCTPCRLDYPLDDPAGMGHAQRGDGRKGMKNVAHGTETDHEQAKLGLRLQILIFSQASLA
jgi:hypothetical protein